MNSIIKEQKLTELIKLINQNKDKIVLVQFDQKEHIKELKYTDNCINKVLLQDESDGNINKDMKYDRAIKLLDKDSIISSYWAMNTLSPNLRITYIFRIKDILNDINKLEIYGITPKILLDILKFRNHKDYKLDKINYDLVILLKYGVLDRSRSVMRNGIFYNFNECQCEYCCED